MMVLSLALKMYRVQNRAALIVICVCFWVTRTKWREPTSRPEFRRQAHVIVHKMLPILLRHPICMLKLLKIDILK